MKNPIRGNALTRVLATVLLAGTLNTAALVRADVAGFEGTGYVNLIGDGGIECINWVAGFDQNAMTYAAQIDEAMQYQALLERVGEQVEGRIDGMRIAIQASRLSRAVDQGIKDSREAFRPWMDR